MIVLTGILAGALLVVGLIPLFLDLIVIWIAVALMLVAVAGRLSRGTAFGQLPGYRVLPHGSGSWAVTMAFPLAVAGVTAVAGSFFMAGVPLAGGLVLTTAAASILIVMLAGASA